MVVVVRPLHVVVYIFTISLCVCAAFSWLSGLKIDVLTVFIVVSAVLLSLWDEAVSPNLLLYRNKNSVLLRRV